MDIKLEKKPWYIRYRYYLAGGVAFLAFLIYVVTLSLGPSKLRIEQDNIQIAEVKNGKFMDPIIYFNGKHSVNHVANFVN